MIISMLRAMDKMLERGNDENIQDARAVLAELITHLEANPLSLPKGVIADAVSRTYIDQELDPEAKEAMEDLT